MAPHFQLLPGQDQGVNLTEIPLLCPSPYAMSSPSSDHLLLASAAAHVPTLPEGIAYGPSHNPQLLWNTLQ